ncbi:hypothetical protein Tco_0058608 [Tanacetum coccineum]
MHLELGLGYASEQAIREAICSKDKAGPESLVPMPGQQNLRAVRQKVTVPGQDQSMVRRRGIRRNVGLQGLSWEGVKNQKEGMEFSPEYTSEIQKENARQEKRHKKDGGMQYRSARSNPSGSTVGMIRGKRLWKRSYEELEQWMDNEISFPSVPRCRLVDSPIILEALIECFQVRRIYVDEGSSSEVMYDHCFRNLGSDTKARLRESKSVVGRILWRIVKCYSPYNVILGWTEMRSLRAVASTIHVMIKFSMKNVIATMVTKGETLQECRRIEEAEGPTSERMTTHPRIRASEPQEASRAEGTKSPERQSPEEKSP